MADINMQPQMNPGQEMASPEQMQGLQELLEGTKQKIGEYNANRFAGKNKSEQENKDLLKEVFQMMQDSGIDLTDQASVSEFLDKLKTENPQLFQWFEMAMDGLLGNETITNENINENEYEQPTQTEPPIQALS